MSLFPLGPGARRIYFRNIFIFVICVLLNLAVIKTFSNSHLENYISIILIPISIVAAAAFVGVLGFGPLSKGLKVAIERDEEDERNRLKPKQPWD